MQAAMLMVVSYSLPCGFNSNSVAVQQRNCQRLVMHSCNLEGRVAIWLATEDLKKHAHKPLRTSKTGLAADALRRTPTQTNGPPR